MGQILAIVVLVFPFAMAGLILWDSQRRLKKLKWGWASFTFISCFGAIAQLGRDLKTTGVSGSFGVATIFGILVGAAAGLFTLYRVMNRKPKPSPEQGMDKKLVERIILNVQKTDSSELLYEWIKNYQRDYSEEFFQALERVLKDRGYALPPSRETSDLMQLWINNDLGYAEDLLTILGRGLQARGHELPPQKRNEIKECPNCSFYVASSATHCECGYKFENETFDTLLIEDSINNSDRDSIDALQDAHRASNEPPEKDIIAQRVFETLPTKSAQNGFETCLNPTIFSYSIPPYVKLVAVASRQSGKFILLITDKRLLFLKLNIYEHLLHIPVLADLLGLWMSLFGSSGFDSRLNISWAEGQDFAPMAVRLKSIRDVIEIQVSDISSIVFNRIDFSKGAFSGRIYMHSRSGYNIYCEDFGRPSDIYNPLEQIFATTTAADSRNIMELPPVPDPSNVVEFTLWVWEYYDDPSLQVFRSSLPTGTGRIMLAQALYDEVEEYHKRNKLKDRIYELRELFYYSAIAVEQQGFENLSSTLQARFTNATGQIFVLPYIFKHKYKGQIDLSEFGLIDLWGRHPLQAEQETARVSSTPASNHEIRSTNVPDPYLLKSKCNNCGHTGFDYDSYWDEYSCKTCGWILKKSGE